jgi:ribosomal protection tetracycline resistance protein
MAAPIRPRRRSAVSRLLTISLSARKTGWRPAGFTDGLGTRAAGFTAWGEQDAAARARLAEVLAETDERILAAYVDDELAVPYDRLRRELATQTRRARVYPVFFGAAVTGAGVAALMVGLAELLPAAAGDAGGPVAGRVFKIERGACGEKVAYVRMFSGTVRTRDRLRFGSGREAYRAGKVTGPRCVLPSGSSLSRIR